MALSRLLAIPALQLGHLVAESWSAFKHQSPYADVPPLDPSLRLIGEALLDRTFKLTINVLVGVPRPAEVRAMVAEAEATLDFMDSHGWLADPASYHRTPPPVDDWRLTPRAAWGTGGRTRFNHLEFESGFEPHAGAPGGERWSSYEPNRTAHAWVLEHESGPRPWVVCVHGFAMGIPTIDFTGFQVRRLYHDLGLNVVLPCLPLHGPRSSSRFSGGQILAPDYLNMIHLFSQAVWDIRRVISWIRKRGGEKIGLYGVSLGAYNAALTASLEPGLDCVIAGIPAVDFPNLARDNEPWVMRRYYDDEFEVDWQMIRAITHVVSPLAFKPKIPRERRFIFAGIADRVVKPDQARALWRHWGQPEIFWFSGGHVVGQMKRAIADFVDRSLRSVGFAVADPGREADA